MLRDLLETAEFKNSPSNISFAVGKDIGGKVVVTDIAKMPHLLIAGATVPVNPSALIRLS